MNANSSHTKSVHSAVVWTLRALALVACGIAVYLTWAAIEQGPLAGCDNEGKWDCSVVLQSRWSKLFGLPVSLAAVITYSLMLAALAMVHRPAWARIAWSTVTVSAVSAVGAGIWFMAVQKFLIRGFCVYCITAHAIGLAILIILLLVRPIPLSAMSKWSIGGIAGVLFLVASQNLVEPPPSHEVDVYVVNGSGDSESSPELIMDMDADTEVFDMTFDLDDESPSPNSDNSSNTSSRVEVSDDKSGQTSTSRATIQPVSLVRRCTTSDVPTGGAPVASTSPVPPSTDSHTRDTANSAENTIAQTAPREETADKAEAEAKRYVTLLKNKARLNVYQWPILGSPDADHMLVELFDYTCSHCRKMHHYMKAAQERFGNQVAVVALPLPLNTKCNPAVSRTSSSHIEACELAKYALAVFLEDPSVFATYHDWLFESRSKRRAKAARAKAVEMIGEKALTAWLESDKVKKYLHNHANLYKLAGKGSIPKLMHTRFTITGEPRSTDALCRILERRLDIRQ